MFCAWNEYNVLHKLYPNKTNTKLKNFFKWHPIAQCVSAFSGSRDPLKCKHKISLKIWTPVPYPHGPTGSFRICTFPVPEHHQWGPHSWVGSIFYVSEYCTLRKKASYVIRLQHPRWVSYSSRVFCVYRPDGGTIDLGSPSWGSWAESCWPPAFVNQVLLAHSWPICLHCLRPFSRKKCSGIVGTGTL